MLFGIGKTLLANGFSRGGVQIPERGGPDPMHAGTAGRGERSRIA